MKETHNRIISLFALLFIVSAPGYNISKILLCIYVLLVCKFNQSTGAASCNISRELL